MSFWISGFTLKIISLFVICDWTFLIIFLLIWCDCGGGGGGICSCGGGSGGLEEGTIAFAIFVRESFLITTCSLFKK